MQVVVPGNGGIPLVSVDDLAIANAKLLVSDEYINQTVNLPGPKVRLPFFNTRLKNLKEFLLYLFFSPCLLQTFLLLKIQDLKELTLVLAEQLGHKIDFKIVSEEEWLARNTQKVHARPWASAYPALAKGREGGVLWGGGGGAGKL
mgnify:CR=1 FL=1